MAWSRKYTLIVGVLLILLTNMIALGGIAYNRMGKPLAVTKLSARELQIPYYWKANEENSGIELNLRWRFAGQDRYSYSQGAVNANSESQSNWLNKDKLWSLGFDVSKPADSPEGRRHYDRVLSRDVLLVLELNGPAYKKTLESARQNLSNEEALVKTNAGDLKVSERRMKFAKDQLDEEVHVNSRLFVVDAGLELNSLRQKYPDTSQYAIVKGQVGLEHVKSGNNFQLQGYVRGISVTTINVPFKFRHLFESMRRTYPSSQQNDGPPYEATIAYGQRLEPWITEISWVKKPE